MQNSILLYGANGYTGELIARFSHLYGLKPILAGRRKEVIEPMATKLGLPFRIVDLHDPAALTNALKDIKLVIQAAGPYDITAKPMIEACIATGTHYIDLNGDLRVFEMLQSYNKQAIEKDIMILPGAGFDVVPTDCLALFLKNRLPDASQLKIAFAILGSGLSRGTAISTFQHLGMPGFIRQDGILTPEPMGKRGMWVQFPTLKQKLFTMTIPWGDLSTAYFSTGIPNIETYTGISKSVWTFLKAQSLYNWLLRTSLVRRIATTIVNIKSAGPNDAVRNKAVSLIWAKVTNPQGKSLEATIRCPEGYSLTADAVLLISQKIMNGQYKSGYQTPASAYGEDLIMELPGVVRESTTM